MRKPSVVFLCTHNAGRSQMALGFFSTLAGQKATAYSGGSEPANQINPAAVAVMAEKGIDITAQQPMRWTEDMIQAADVVVTMGCGEACPVHPGQMLRGLAAARSVRAISRGRAPDPRRDRGAGTDVAV
jgi:arsenate reductase (thioredoxin)